MVVLVGQYSFINPMSLYSKGALVLEERTCKDIVEIKPLGLLIKGSLAVKVEVTCLFKAGQLISSLDKRSSTFAIKRFISLAKSVPLFSVKSFMS